MIFPLLQLYCTFTALVRKCGEINGAGEGNRTLVSGLGSPHSTIEPHPHPGRAWISITAILTTQSISSCHCSFQLHCDSVREAPRLASPDGNLRPHSISHEWSASHARTA